MFSMQKRMLLSTGVVLALMTPAYAHLEVDTPNGGETLEVGSVVPITWHITIAHNSQNWDLWYSTQGPDGWTPIEIDSDGKVGGRDGKTRGGEFESDGIPAIRTR